MCAFTAGFRNLIAYADFITMAAIAANRSYGIVTGRFRRLRFMGRRTSHIFHLLICLAIWAMAFVIISPAIFHFNIGEFSFGSFGWDPKNGKCEVNNCGEVEGIKGGGVIYIYGVIIPLLVLITSYITLGLFVNREVKEIIADKRPEDHQVCNTWKIFGQLQLHPVE